MSGVVDNEKNGPFGSFFFEGLLFSFPLLVLLLSPSFSLNEKEEKRIRGEKEEKKGLNES